MDDELLAFVKESLSRGRSRAEIADALQRAGWSREQSASGLDAFADVDFPVPVPMPRPYVSARDAFVYLVLFTALYVAAYHLGSLTFDLINLAFPDRSLDATYSQYVRMGMRWAIASLVVAFPVFAFMTRKINREVAGDPGKRRSKVRRWLTYLTLFVAACVLIGDLTTLVYNALGGELTVRFVLKVLTVGVIAGAVVAYYLHDLQLDERRRPPIAALRRGIGFATPLVVGAVGLAGVVAMGTPDSIRQERLDERRVADLRQVSRMVDFFHTRRGALPPSLDELSRESGVAPLPRDPESDRPYEYRVKGPKAYEVCADFDRVSEGDGHDFWWHGPGRHCFDMKPAEASR
jgi:Domain of unknown function (DUF5671)